MAKPNEPELEPDIPDLLELGIETGDQRRPRT